MGNRFETRLTAPAAASAATDPSEDLTDEATETAETKTSVADVEPEPEPSDTVPESVDAQTSVPEEPSATELAVAQPAADVDHPTPEREVVPVEPVSAAPAPKSEPTPVLEPVPSEVAIETAALADISIPRKPSPPSPVPEPRATAQPAPPSSVGTRTETAALTGTNDLGSNDGDSATGGGTVGDVQDYFAVLKAMLERHKSYPARAQRRGQQGVVAVALAIGSDGRLTSVELRRSSGFRELDRAAVDAVERAQPFPPIPQEMNRDTLRVVLPLRFEIR